jgi:putative transposase
VIRSLAVALAIGCDLSAVLFRSRAGVIAENLFLRRQLALYLERKTRRRRPTPATKFALVILSRFFPWAGAVAIVKLDTFVRWHRTGFRLFWRWKSRHAGRPPLPKNLRSLITAMARENPSWGEGRIGDELSLKLGLFVDSRIIRHHRLELGPFRLTAGFMILILLNDGPIQGTTVFSKLS